MAAVSARSGYEDPFRVAVDDARSAIGSSALGTPLKGRVSAARPWGEIGEDGVPNCSSRREGVSQRALAAHPAFASPNYPRRVATLTPP